VSFALEQIQTETGLFTMPLEIELCTSEGSEIHSISNQNAQEEYVFEIDHQPYDVVIDPDQWVLKWVSLHPDQFQFINEYQLPRPAFGEMYSVQLDMINGTAPFSFEFIEGEFPLGITFDPETGIISGFPLKTGRYNFTVMGTDSREPPRYCLQEFFIKTGTSPAIIRIHTNQDEYTGDENLAVSLQIINGSTDTDAILYVVLEIMGEFLFLDFFSPQYPAFTADAVGVEITLPAEYTIEEDIFELFLPAGLDSFEGTFHTALISPSNGTAVAPLAQADFQYADDQ